MTNELSGLEKRQGALVIALHAQITMSVSQIIWSLTDVYSLCVLSNIVV